MDPPVPEDAQDTKPNSEGSKGVRRAQLKEQEKQFRETMLQLFEKVNDLKTQLDSIHTSDVFSVAILKQTQEIERLAKRLKNFAKT